MWKKLNVSLTIHIQFTECQVIIFLFYSYSYESMKSCFASGEFNTKLYVLAESWTLLQVIIVFKRPFYITTYWWRNQCIWFMSHGNGSREDLYEKHFSKYYHEKYCTQFLVLMGFAIISRMFHEFYIHCFKRKWFIKYLGE